MAMVELYEELKGNNPKGIEPEKFIASLSLGEDENAAILKEYDIYLTPAQWIALTIEPEVLEKTLLRAKDLGFLDAYKQNPAYLKQDVDAVLKRMGELDHLGIPYKNEKGKYLSYLFSKRAFEYVISKHAQDSNLVINNIELQDFADRIMEIFGLTNEADNIYKMVALAESEGLGIKESLVKGFEKYTDSDIEFLKEQIDEVIKSESEGIKRG